MAQYGGSSKAGYKNKIKLKKKIKKKMDVFIDHSKHGKKNEYGPTSSQAKIFNSVRAE